MAKQSGRPTSLNTRAKAPMIHHYQHQDADR